MNTALLLSSPAPLVDNLRKYNFLYVLFIVVGAVVGFIVTAGQNANAWFCFVLLGVAVAYIIKALIATKMVISLNKLSFQTPKQISGSAMAGMITLPLTQLGMTVSVVDNEAVIAHQNMLYYVRNFTDGTFGLVFDQKMASALFTGRRYISQYKKAIVAMGLIAYTIQQEMEKAYGASVGAQS